MTDYQWAAMPAVEQHLRARGITPETQATFRLGGVDEPHPGHAQYRGMLSIPYLDRDSRALTVRFRNLGDGPKYLTIKDDPARMFNVRAIHQAVAAHSDEIHVTEGEFDAMVLSQIGLFAVAVPGASGWQAHYRRMLAGFSRVWVWGDPDEAGAQFTTRVCQAMRSAKGVRIRGGDINELYLKDGAGALLSLVGKG